MTFPARLERFRAVDSTQRVVREWLDQGQDEVEAKFQSWLAQ